MDGKYSKMPVYMDFGSEYISWSTCTHDITDCKLWGVIV